MNASKNPLGGGGGDAHKAEDQDCGDGQGLSSRVAGLGSEPGWSACEVRCVPKVLTPRSSYSRKWIHQRTKRKHLHTQTAEARFRLQQKGSRVVSKMAQGVKVLAVQAQLSEFNPWNMLKYRRQQPTTHSCSLTSKWAHNTIVTTKTQNNKTTQAPLQFIWRN